MWRNYHKSKGIPGVDGDIAEVEMPVSYCQDHKIQYKSEDYAECPLCFQNDYLSYLLDDNIRMKDENKKYRNALNLTKRGDRSE